jgi:hypothetical protein
MNKPLFALLLVLIVGLSGLGLLLPPSQPLFAGTPTPNADSEPNRPLPPDWEQRMRAYHKAQARLQLNQSLSPEDKRAALERLRNEHFNGEELRWLERFPTLETAPLTPPAPPH